MAAALFGGRRFGLFRLDFGLGDDRVNGFCRQPTHLHQRIWFDDRQVIITQESLFDELFGQLEFDSIEFTEPVDGSLNRFGQFLLGHNLDIPATQFTCQADILPTSPDGQRQLILTDQDDGASEHLAENHLFNFGRLQGIGDQDLQVIAPADNINPLSGELVHNVFDPIAADADTGPHTVDAGIGTDNRHLRAVARFTGHCLDFNHSVDDLWNLLFEEPLDQVRPNPTQDDLDAAPRLADFEHGRPDALIGVMRLTRYLFAPRQDRFDVGKRDRGRTPLIAMDHPGDHLPDQVMVFSMQCLTFCLTDLLNHDLLGRLRTDPPDRFLRIEQFTVADASDLAGLAVDVDDNIPFFPVVPLGRRHERCFDAFENNFLFDILITMDRVDDPHYFGWIHCVFYSPQLASAIGCLAGQRSPPKTNRPGAHPSDQGSRLPSGNLVPVPPRGDSLPRCGREKLLEAQNLVFSTIP